ncbi:protein of unknown function [Legionella fallonii LLAP-10]|uniref:Uncharacterized protein n=1 Tax=Legionella fallonii LLAP-10 TaxID=1212491 RepID=A0A098G6V0_9GAMM|nr:protein of unknown function [Legionella fallonii LLAP-10]
MLYLIYGTAGDGDHREDIKPKVADILSITSQFNNMNYEATVGGKSIRFNLSSNRDTSIKFN